MFQETWNQWKETVKNYVWIKCIVIPWIFCVISGIESRSLTSLPRQTLVPGRYILSFGFDTTPPYQCISEAFFGTLNYFPAAVRLHLINQLGKYKLKDAYEISRFICVLKRPQSFCYLFSTHWGSLYVAHLILYTMKSNFLFILWGQERYFRLGTVLRII